MARVTVEDCDSIVNNRFDLVLIAAQRARQISSGSPALIDADNDKSTVIALREIASEKVSPSILSEALIASYQKVADVNVIETVSASVVEDTVSEATAEALLQDGYILDGDTVETKNMFEDMNMDAIVD